MGNCEKLKWNRKRLGMSQKDFAEKVGLSVATIGRLEQDEMNWEVVTDETFDKIANEFDNDHSWKIRRPEKNDTIVEKKTEQNDERKNDITKQSVCMLIKKDDKDITQQDTMTFVLVKFAYEGMKESKTHDEFIANINLLKRIIRDY